MRVYLKGRKYPIVIETNVAWALPYWTKRKQSNPLLYWKFGTLIDN